MLLLTVGHEFQMPPPVAAFFTMEARENFALSFVAEVDPMVVDASVRVVDGGGVCFGRST